MGNEVGPPVKGPPAEEAVVESPGRGARRRVRSRSASAFSWERMLGRVTPISEPPLESHPCF